MKRAEGVWSDLSLGTKSSFLKGGKLKANRYFPDMYSIFNYDVLKNLHPGLFVALNACLMSYWKPNIASCHPDGLVQL